MLQFLRSKGGSRSQGPNGWRHTELEAVHRVLTSSFLPSLVSFLLFERYVPSVPKRST